MKLAQGFTLAETLITLGIIGVVAILVMKNLQADTSKSEAYTKLLKANSVISNAAAQIREENGGTMEDAAAGVLEMAKLFAEKMNVAKFCNNSSDSANCYINNSDNMYTLNGGYIGDYTPYPYSTYSKIVTHDGIVYIFELIDKSCKSTKYTRNGIGENFGTIMVDTNGIKSPNSFGKDVFSFSINKYNVTPANTSICDPTVTTDKWNGLSCTARALNEGGIKY